MTALNRENATLDKWLVTNEDRIQWFNQRVQLPISTGEAITWLETLNLQGTTYVFKLAQKKKDEGNLLGAVEMLRLFACASLQKQEFSNATIAVQQLHLWLVQGAISPRDFFLDDYLNTYLPKFCAEDLISSQKKRDQNQIRIGYLVPMSLDAKSTLPPIPGELGSQHSKEFSVTLCIPYPRDVVEQTNPNLVKTLQSTYPADAIVYNTEEYEDEWDRVHSFAKLIHDLNLDALITMLAIYADSLISYMRPAPKIYAIDAGHPHWYSHRFMDKVFSGHPQFQLEAQTDSIYVPLGFTARAREKAIAKPGQVLEKIEFAKKSHVTLFSSGSNDKFLFDDTWTMVNAILRETGANWLFLGPDPGFVLGKIDRDFHDLVRTFPRSQNFDHFLKHTDLYVDTFPIGGGYSLLEAFEKGIACALYSHDFSKPFNKRNIYAPYSHISEDPSFASASNRDAFREHIIELANSKELRQKQVELQNEAAPKVLGSDQMIAAIEQTLRSEVA